MSANLIINGSGAASVEWGVAMGDGFLDALTAPLSLKDPMESESRLEQGKRIFPDETPLFKSRELTLDFTIKGDSPTDLREKKNLFLAEMYRGIVEIKVPDVSGDVYRLYYRGCGTEYGMDYARTFCHMMLKFEEPDPTDRGEVSKYAGSEL